MLRASASSSTSNTSNQHHPHKSPSAVPALKSSLRGSSTSNRNMSMSMNSSFRRSTTSTRSSTNEVEGEGACNVSFLSSSSSRSMSILRQSGSSSLGSKSRSSSNKFGRRGSRSTTSSAGGLGRGQRTSFLSRARQSFLRSRGDRGANVETLRGVHGSDFEGECYVTRGESLVVRGHGHGNGPRLLRNWFWHACCLVGGSNAIVNKKLYVLVKGTNLFIFQSEHASAPLYAVDLPHRVIALHSPKEEFLNKTCTTGSHPEGLKTQIVTLETGLGDVEYSLMFDVSLKENEDLAEKCANAMRKEAKAGETNEVKKSLGHAPDFKPSKSVTYADTVALAKVLDAPEKPITLAEATTSQYGPNHHIVYTVAYQY